jgi:hypothetical protein
MKQGQAESLGWKILDTLGRGGQADVYLVERKSEPGGVRFALSSTDADL